MEERSSEGRWASLEVIMYAGSKGCLHGSTLDLTLNGMLVDIHQVILNEGDHVEVVFPVDCGDQSQQCRAIAIVENSILDCTELRFSHIDSNVKQMLRKMLFGYATVSQRAYLTQNHAMTKTGTYHHNF